MWVFAVALPLFAIGVWQAARTGHLTAGAVLVGLALVCLWLLAGEGGPYEDERW